MHQPANKTRVPEAAAAPAFAADPAFEHDIDPGSHQRLTPTERAEAEQVARRLVSELRPLVVLLPESDRGASAMSRLLSLDRATCQRLVAAVSRPDSGVETIVQLPGIQGLRQFIAAVALLDSAKLASERLDAARAAVDRLAELIDELGGSQRKLRARLAAERAGSPSGTIAAPGGSDDLGVRQALFRAAAAATGRWSDVLISAVMIRPTPGRPDMTDTVHTRALIGHRARPDAVPLEVGQSPQAPNARADGAGAGRDAMTPERSAGRLVEEFCSRPLPRIVTRTSALSIAHVVDVPQPAAHQPGTPHGGPQDPSPVADIVLMQRRPSPDRHPATLNPPVGEVWRMVSFPVRHMLFDVFLHREIARRCIPSLEVHLWTPETVGHVRARWSTRFSGGPRLEMMGAGLARIGSGAYPRYTELASHIMDSLGWDAAEFVGYRCEVSYPIWRAGYCMSFDFAGNEITPAAPSPEP